jgi:DNA-binding IclR family transcriptional regulator
MAGARPLNNALPENPQRQRSLDRLLALLAFLHKHGKPIRIGDLARLLDAPRSSTYELVRLLLEAGLLEQGSADGSIFFGKMMYFYGTDFVREHDLVSRAREEVDRLAREAGETSQFCMLQGRYYTVVHMAAGTRPFRISSDIGTQIPLPWTASGRLLLAHLSDQEIRALVAPEDLAMPNGDVIGMDDFIASIGVAKALGHCITSGLVDAFTYCIAAPIFGPGRHVVATLCFVVPVDTPDDRRDALRDTLVNRGLALSTIPS